MESILRLGEKVLFESNSNFELGTFGKLSLGDKKIFITNLGNIIIQDNSNLFKKDVTTYYYNYSQYKKKFNIILDNNTIILQNNELPLEVITNTGKEVTNYKLVIKINFDQFKDLCKNQREFIGDLQYNQVIFSIDNSELVLGTLFKDENRFLLKKSDLDMFEVRISDIEECKINDFEINLEGYFYKVENDSILRSIYIFSNNKAAFENLDKKVESNNKIGRLPAGSNIYYGEISTTVDKTTYNNSPVFIIKNNEKIAFVDKNKKNTIFVIKTPESKKLILNDDILIYDDKNLFTIKTSNINKNDMGILSLDDLENSKIGFTQNHTPFFIQHNEEGFNIYRSSNSMLLSIKNDKFKDIIINNEVKKSNDNYTPLEIKFDAIRIIVNINNNIVSKIIRDVFVYSKRDLVQSATINDLYFNWAKSISDMILFNLFGSLYYTKLEIDNILSREITDDDRVKIVNMMYYQIQNQRNQLDIISAYIPKAIERGEAKLFYKYNQNLDHKVFKVLHKQLFTISSQINKYLSDIERSLSQLSFVIYSEFNTREFNTKLKNKQVGIGVAVSVASSLAMGGALSVPFLAMQGMSLYSNKKMDEKSKEIESSKLHLFTNQSIEKLNHLIENMYPYYVNEANDNLREIFTVLGEQYKNHNDKRIKQDLFDRITEIYVSKQMTLNNMTNMRKKDIIDTVYKSIDSNMNLYDTNMFLIGGIS